MCLWSVSRLAGGWVGLEETCDRMPGLCSMCFHMEQAYEEVLLSHEEV